MAKRWFARQNRFDGKYVPVLFHGSRPDNKTADGVELKLKDVYEVPDYLDHLGLDDLDTYYEPSPIGEQP